MKTTITPAAAAVEPLAPRLEDEAQHTPGPWTAERMFNPPGAKDRTCGFVVNGPETGEPLPARICDLRVPPGMGSFSEYRANARLIASAPALLAALESIAENLQNRAMTGEQEAAFKHNASADSWRVYLSSLIIQARNEARSAITAARGGG